MAYAMGRTPSKSHQGPEGDAEVDPGAGPLMIGDLLHLEEQSEPATAGASAGNLDPGAAAAPAQVGLKKPVSVRRLTGEWEKGLIPDKPKTVSPPRKTNARQKPTVISDMIKGRPSAESSEKSTRDRVTEARIHLQKAKTGLGESRNIRGDIKVDVTRALDKLYQLVKEAEADLTKARSTVSRGAPPPPHAPVTRSPSPTKDANLARLLEENSKLLRENTARMEVLKTRLELQIESTERAATYAGVVAGIQKPAAKNGALHSVVVSSKDETETGEEVLRKVRQVLDAKEGWVKVERVRKAKDQKVIMGFGTKEERDKVKKRIEQNSAHLSIEDVKNKDPLLILKGVLKIHSDEDIMRALRNQNRGVFRDLDAGEDRVELKYKRNTKNSLTCHVILSVAPRIWSRATERGRLRIDLQQVRVEDQSPLVQCTRCLGYGHSRRFCKEPADLCSHCGGPHLGTECADRLAGDSPACINCVRAKFSKTDHNVFNQECPVRRRWDEIARSTVAYC